MSSRLDPVRLSSRTRGLRICLRLGLVATIVVGVAGLASSVVEKWREATARTT